MKSFSPPKASYRGAKSASLRTPSGALGVRESGDLGRPSLTVLTRWGLAAALVAFGSSCGGGSGGDQGSSTNPVFTYNANGPSGSYFTDNNQQGQANQLVIENMFWGRMVDVYGMDAAGERVLMHENMVIGKGIQGDGIDFLLATNAVTAVQELTILRDVEDVSVQGGYEQFEVLLRETQQSLDPVTQRGPGTTSGGSAGLFSMVPRNATLVLELNDLVDPDSIDNTTVRVLTGPDFSGTYEARILPDPNFGDVADLDGQPGLEFYSTRVLIDPTISIIESFDFNPPVPVNSDGLPPSTSVNLANLMLRIPTELNPIVGQTRHLQNPSGHSLSTVANGAWDASVSTNDIYRAMRSGGGTLVTGDAYNGFLLDQEPPTVVGANIIEILSPPQQLASPNEFLLPSVSFESVFCAALPRPGDVIAQVDQGIFADVISAVTITGSDVTNVRVRLRQYPAEWDLPGGGGPGEWENSGVGSGEFQTAYDPSTDAGRVACFLRINPLPSGYPNNPAFGVDPAATFQIRFSEPMDSASITAFDSMLLTRQQMAPNNDPPLPTSAFVVGSVALAPDLQRFTFEPEVGLSHAQGASEEYYLTLLPGDLGATDLAGNQIGGDFPAIPFSLDSALPSVETGGRVSRFSGLDEEPEDPFPIIPGDPTDYGTMPEWGGQHLFNLNQEYIFPRPVTRFTAVADRTQTVPALMTPFSVGIQTPISNLGSKTQIVYRFMDFGWTLEDASNANVDVTGISWAPVNGLVTFDSYDEFEIRMSHSRYAPDELIDGGTLWPMWPNSGLSNVYNTNLLDGISDPQKVMHEKSMGYQIDPGTIYQVGNGLTKFVPYPLNQNLTDPNDERSYTWRDTSLLNRAGASNGGSPPDVQLLALGLDPNTDIFAAGRIRTTGLALLVEFRCYADSSANGLNGFDINLAANSSSKPYMRAFSTGGIDSGNSTNVVNPDTANTSSGGYGVNGQSTYGRDNSFYLGALDFVTRVSRSFSIWFPAYDPSIPGETFSSPNYREPVLEPRSADQPGGTSVTVAFRGASDIVPHPVAEGNLGGRDPDPMVDPGTRHVALANASELDIYGDHYWEDTRHNPINSNVGIEDLMGNSRLVDEAWRDTIQEINGARFYQIRLTFESNVVSNENPTLSAIAVSWEQ